MNKMPISANSFQIIILDIMHIYVYYYNNLIEGIRHALKREEIDQVVFKEWVGQEM